MTKEELEKFESYVDSAISNGGWTLMTQLDPEEVKLLFNEIRNKQQVIDLVHSQNNGKNELISEYLSVIKNLQEKLEIATKTLNTISRYYDGSYNRETRIDAAYVASRALTKIEDRNRCGLCLPDKPCNMAGCRNDEEDRTILCNETDDCGCLVCCKANAGFIQD